MGFSFFLICIVSLSISQAIPTSQAPLSSLASNLEIQKQSLLLALKNDKENKDLTMTDLTTQFSTIQQSIYSKSKEYSKSNSDLLTISQQISDLKFEINENSKVLKQKSVQNEFQNFISDQYRKSQKYFDDNNQNAKIFAVWRKDFNQFSTTLRLPGSLSDPAQDILTELDNFETLMKSSASNENKFISKIKNSVSSGNFVLSKNSDVSKNFTNPFLGNLLNELQNKQNELIATLRSLPVEIHTLQLQLQFLAQQKVIVMKQFESRENNTQNQIISLNKLLTLLTNGKDLFSSCPNKCSGNGICQDNSCICTSQFEGVDCARRVKDIYYEPPSPFAPKKPDYKALAKSYTSRNVFRFDKSTESFISSDEIYCSGMKAVTIAMWINPFQGVNEGGATLFSYSTNSKNSELLIWIDQKCEGLYLWVNSVSRNDLEGVLIANFTKQPICDNTWHHLVITWDGKVGGARVFKDGVFHEQHWSVFNRETIKEGGRIVLGHNQVHLKEQQVGYINDAFIGQMSDVFVIINETLTNENDAIHLFENGVYNGDKSFIYWSLNNNNNTNLVKDLGSFHLNGMSFGGDWVLSNDRYVKCAFDINTKTEIN